jgi:hypothetical protein
MDQIAHVIAALRDNPLLAGAVGVALVLGYAMLRRRPRIQREADERLSELRRDKSDQYSKLRPPH